MTPEQALNVLVQVTAQITANREVHGQISQALASIQAAINELAKLKAPKPEEKAPEKK